MLPALRGTLVGMSLRAQVASPAMPLIVPVRRLVTERSIIGTHAHAARADGVVKGNCRLR